MYIPSHQELIQFLKDLNSVSLNDTIISYEQAILDNDAEAIDIYSNLAYEIYQSENSLQ